MKVCLIAISKCSFPFVQQGVNEFSKRLKNYSNFEYKELTLPKKYTNSDALHLKRYEADLILKNIDPKDHVVLLDENGTVMNSRSFASWIQKKMSLSLKSCVFIIGGAYGFDDRIYKRANQKISLSSMTFSHQLIRVIFLEQLYRAFTILNNEKYHND